MMHPRFFVLLLALCFSFPAFSQGFAFGAKGGLTVGFQKWNGFEQDPLYKYHGIAYIESLSEEDLYSVFAQAGYHVKGSAIRNQQGFTINNNFIRLPAREFLFKNVSLTLGAKRKFKPESSNKPYWLLAIRGDYTVDTNLETYRRFNELNGLLYYPVPEAVNKFNYGITVGGGIEFMFAELTGGLIEFTINPDFSRQYEQPTLQNVTNPYTSERVTLSERLIKNVTFEISVGVRFLNKYEYVDE